jgi:hypothetical protein
MCSVDVTPIVWTWDKKAQRSVSGSDTLHSCQNFKKIQQWARDHQLDGEFITTVHVEDDLAQPRRVISTMNYEPIY